MDQKQKSEIVNKMEKAISILDKDLKGLRIGRASVNFLDPVVVEVYGSRVPLSQISTISTPDARTLSVQVWDKNMVKTVEKAIAEANLGLNPSADGQVIRMTLPVVSQERRNELTKLAAKYGEDSKIALRNVRRDAMDAIKQMEQTKQISKDEHRNLSTDIQKMTDDYIKKIDSMVKVRAEEIMTV